MTYRYGELIITIVEDDGDYQILVEADGPAVSVPVTLTNAAGDAVRWAL